ncbi:hypothetical protein G9F72_009625 [Clostridium estertheticum]|uniref:hypothetical protein n=1 Tax=Clostridium estertheticum TaxID=238834 RepID=UPI0013E98C8D|nr:hypothetical protein [Clostridium estertheticum]MBZ9686586.1 hypothetical protein [Clostridium estertheticum]
MTNNNNLEQTKKATTRSNDNKGSKTYSNEGLNSSTSDATPKETGRLNIQSTGNDFYTGISNDDMSNMTNSTNYDDLEERKQLNTRSDVNKSNTKK